MLPWLAADWPSMLFSLEVHFQNSMKKDGDGDVNLHPQNWGNAPKFNDLADSGLTLYAIEQASVHPAS
jgi:hypothetical protein